MPSSKGHITQGQAVHALNDVSHKVCVKEACQVASELWLLIIFTKTINVSGVACKRNKMTPFWVFENRHQHLAQKSFGKLLSRDKRAWFTYQTTQPGLLPLTANRKRQPEKNESTRKFIYFK